VDADTHFHVRRQIVVFDDVQREAVDQFANDVPWGVDHNAADQRLQADEVVDQRPTQQASRPRSVGREPH
jgi:hypothetical protein